MQKYQQKRLIVLPYLSPIGPVFLGRIINSRENSKHAFAAGQRPSEYRDWDSECSDLWQVYGQKLHRIILLHFGRITFRFHYRKDRKPIMFMISAFSDVSMTPKTNTIYLWRHQDIPNISR